MAIVPAPTLSCWASLSPSLHYNLLRACGDPLVQRQVISSSPWTSDLSPDGTVERAPGIPILALLRLAL